MSEPVTGPALDAVIFDLGGVLARNGRHSDLAARFPAEHAATLLPLLVGPFEEDTDHPWHRLERGEITFDEYRRASAELLAERGITLPAPADRGGGGDDFRFHTNDAVVALVHELRGRGVRCGVLTNNVAELRPLWQGMLPFGELFDDVVDSSAVGMRKPNPAIYRLALDRLGVTADRAAFLDDVPANVAAAEGVGMRGVVVDVDPTAAVSTVRAWVGLPG
jgi:epoxide hydrolase-like predicted phosphatase